MTHILVVDVNATTAYRIKKILYGMDVDVETTSTVNETINRLAGSPTPFDMIVADFNLGSEDGYDLMAKVMKSHPEIMLIVLTSKNKRSSFVNAIKIGASDYIIKPYEENYFTNKMRNHIKAIEASKKLPYASPKTVDTTIYTAVKKAVREDYELLIGLFVIYHKNPMNSAAVNVKDSAILKTLQHFIEDHVGEGDEYLTHGPNALVLILPKKSREMKTTIQNGFEQLCKSFIETRQIEDTYAAVEFISLPAEVDVKQNALAVLAEKIEARIKD